MKNNTLHYLHHENFVLIVVSIPIESRELRKRWQRDVCIVLIGQS
jgi:hypothetical protein